MSLSDRMAGDIGRVFFNPRHFSETHTWNGREIQCVADDERTLKRHHGNAEDIAWDNNIAEKLIFVPVEGFPGKVQPNEQVIFDGKAMRVSSVIENVGVYEIHLLAQEVRTLG